MARTNDAPLITVLDAGHLLDGLLDLGGVASLGHLEVYPATQPGEIVKRAAAASVVLTNKTPLSAETIAMLPALRFIGVLATGYNVVDVAAARARGIPVSNVPAYGTESVAQHVFALILELCNHVGLHAAAVARGHWSVSAEWCAPLSDITELDGLCLGLIGRGRIAQRVAGIGRAFGMRVLMASTSYPSGGEGLAPLDEIRATADILSLHCQLNATNAKMIGPEFLRRMKATSFLINNLGPPTASTPAKTRAHLSSMSRMLSSSVSEEPRATGPWFSRRMNLGDMPWAARNSRARARPGRCREQR